MMHPQSDHEFRILIVDDNEAIHSDLKKILLPPERGADLIDDEALLFGKSVAPKVRFCIDSAFQGQDGLASVAQAQAEDQPFALAFIDIRMPPGWDGIETIARLWQHDPDLQIVICTAYSDYNWRDIELKLGLSHNLVILKKPFDPIEVLQLAHALTAKWASSRQARVRMEELDKLVEERTTQLHGVIKELKEAKELAEAAALQDPLTKLPNRRFLHSRLTLALQQSERDKSYVCALLYLDVDRFKVINDSLGHVAGDELLVEVAGRLESCLRLHEDIRRPAREDTVARLGGDEFAVLLDGIRDTSDALRVAQRVAKELSLPFRLRNRDVSISASIGVATSASHYTRAESMLRDADNAMYRSKASGRGGCVLFDQTMHSEALERLQKESELRQALGRREFFLCYQPIVSLVNRHISGFEALVRWRSDTRGLVSPVDFIPLSEETGLIVPLGGWVLSEACQQVRRWYDRFGENFRPSMSVNISARQFMQPDLVESVHRSLDQAGISGRSLRLELTESVAMHDPERTSRMLGQLQKLGVRLSIDDFGTGYSSLNYLHWFAVDTLKIDRYFVANMAIDERNLNIVRTIITLAHNLRMEVVAEGVETSDQVNLLSSMQCNAVQGYYFSRPLLAEDVDATLKGAPNLSIPFVKARGSAS